MKAKDLKTLTCKVKLVTREQLSQKSRELYDQLAKDSPDILPGLKWFQGHASTPTRDRDDELILLTAFDKTVPVFMSTGTPAITLGHEFDAARAANIGRVTNLVKDASGLMAEGYIGTNQHATAIRKNLDEMVPVDFSIAFMGAVCRPPTEDELKQHGPSLRNVITELELLNIGAVNIGSNRLSHMTPKGMRRRKVQPIPADGQPNTDPEQVDDGPENQDPDLAAIGESIQDGLELLGEAAEAFGEALSQLQLIPAQDGPDDTNPDTNPDDPNAPRDNARAARAERAKRIRGLITELKQGLAPSGAGASQGGN